MTTTHPGDWVGIGFSDNDASPNVAVGPGETVLSDCNVPTQGIYLGVIGRTQPVVNAGSVTLTANVTNYGSALAAAFQELTPSPLSITSFTSNPASLTLGQATNFSVSAVGGTLPYQYAYTGLPPGCATQNTSVLYCQPTGTGGFTVRAWVNDSKAATANRTTSLTVLPDPLLANVSLSSYRVANGTPVTATARVLNGTGITYRWSLNGTVSLACATGSCPITLNHAATYEVNLTVNDSLGRYAWSQDALQVYYQSRPPSPLAVTLALSANQTHPGTQVWVNATLQGGLGPFTYAWTLNDTPISGASASLPFTPQGAGNYTFGITTTDPYNQSAGIATHLEVLPPGMITPLSALLLTNVTVLPTGGSVSLSVTVSGGVGPFQWMWALNGTNTTHTGTGWILTLTAGGNYSYRAWVTDSLLKVAGSNVVVVVVRGGSLPLAIALSANATRIPAGGSVLLTGVATGGALPYSYLWSKNGTNDSSLGTSASIGITLPHAGNYTFWVTVLDHAGKFAVSNTVHVEVVSPGNGTKGKGNTPGSWPSWEELSVLTVALILLAAIVGVLLYRKRRKDSPDAGRSSRPAQAGPYPDPPHAAPPDHPTTVGSVAPGTSSERPSSAEWPPPPPP